jgi:hypothetical protein
MPFRCSGFALDDSMTAVVGMPVFYRGRELAASHLPEVDMGTALPSRPQRQPVSTAPQIQKVNEPSCCRAPVQVH